MLHYGGGSSDMTKSRANLQSGRPLCIAPQLAQTASSKLPTQPAPQPMHTAHHTVCEPSSSHGNYHTAMQAEGSRLPNAKATKQHVEATSRPAAHVMPSREHKRPTSKHEPPPASAQSEGVCWQIRTAAKPLSTMRHDHPCPALALLGPHCDNRI